MVFGFRKHILIVEDETALAEGIEARLTVEGFKSSIARDGQLGVDMARKEKPDLILLDIIMPRINGWDVCKILKGDPKTKAIPIIMCTALTQIGDSEKAFLVGANDYVTKPYDMNSLVDKVKKFLGEKT